MELQRHYRIARLLFWFAQAIGIFMAAALVLFIGGTLISELIQDLIEIKKDFMVFVLFLCEIFIAAAFVLSWFRKRMGALIIIVLSILVSILWGRESINFVYLHLPLLFSGLLLLFYSYYKEWILKQKA